MLLEAKVALEDASKAPAAAAACCCSKVHDFLLSRASNVGLFVRLPLRLELESLVLEF